MPTSPPAVVRRAVCGPPDPKRRLPGNHSRTAEGPALPADYQLLRQGQGKRHACTCSGTHMWEIGHNRDKSWTLSAIFRGCLLLNTSFGSSWKGMLVLYFCRTRIVCNPLHLAEALMDDGTYQTTQALMWLLCVFLLLPTKPYLALPHYPFSSPFTPLQWHIWMLSPNDSSPLWREEQAHMCLPFREKNVPVA